MNNIDWKKLALCVLGCELAGGSGAIFTGMSVNSWYKDLDKPFFSPPSWVFGPVWTIIFALMGVALYLILQSKARDRAQAINLFIVQFALNILWSLLFFGIRAPWLAFVEIVAMWFFILLTIMSFMRINKTAGRLLFPYLAWVTFASFLNLGIAYLN